MSVIGLIASILGIALLIAVFVGDYCQRKAIRAGRFKDTAGLDCDGDFDTDEPIISKVHFPEETESLWHAGICTTDRADVVPPRSPMDGHP